MVNHSLRKKISFLYKDFIIAYLFIVVCTLPLHLIINLNDISFMGKGINIKFTLFSFFSMISNHVDIMKKGIIITFILSVLCSIISNHVGVLVSKQVLLVVNTLPFVLLILSTAFLIIYLTLGWAIITNTIDIVDVPEIFIYAVLSIIFIGSVILVYTRLSEMYDKLDMGLTLD